MVMEERGGYSEKTEANGIQVISAKAILLQSLREADHMVSRERKGRSHHCIP